jgi:hypothetical protein
MELTIVMYHYVRPLERSRYPNIKGRRLSEFRRQLDYLVDRYRLLRVEDVVAAVRGEHALPPDAALLTFDDGFADHYDYVFPLLDERGLQGAFFPPAHSVLDRELLDVHKIQFILASSPDVAALRREVDVRITADRGESLQSPDYYWQRYARASRFDPAEVIYIKRCCRSSCHPKRDSGSRPSFSLVSSLSMKRRSPRSCSYRSINCGSCSDLGCASETTATPTAGSDHCRTRSSGRKWIEASTSCGRLARQRTTG